VKRRTIRDIVFHSRLRIDGEFIGLERMIQVSRASDR
jgi:hypothetical protein